MSSESPCAQMERGEFDRGVDRRERGQKLERLIHDQDRAEGVLDGFWERGHGTGIGIALLAGSAGYGLGLANVVDQTTVGWPDIVAVAESLGIMAALLAGAFGALMLGIGMGYHRRLNMEADDAE